MISLAEEDHKKRMTGTVKATSGGTKGDAGGMKTTSGRLSTLTSGGRKPPSDRSLNEMTKKPSKTFSKKPKTTLIDRGNDEDSPSNGSSGESDPETPSTATSAVNNNFKDVEETGKWGKVSKKELYFVGTLTAVLVTAIVIVVVVFVGGNRNSSGANGPTAGTMAPTPAPSASEATFESLQEKYDALVDAVATNPHTADLVNLFPTEVNELRTLYTKEELHPAIRAASWILFNDPNKFVGDMVDRFALVALFYATGGEDWFEAENWVTPAHACDWQHVTCKELGTRTLDEIDLSFNNLQGELPSTMALLTDVGVLWLNGNGLEGEIPGEILGSLPRLFILYLQDNEFVGEIPESLRDNGILGTLYVQGNNLNGTWPVSFCFDTFSEFGLNCEQTPCPEDCCDAEYNCFA